MYPRLAKIPNWEQLAKEASFQPALMAALCPVSLRQMERFFVEQFNQTPLEWARQLRCRLARQLIAEGWSSKAVIAELGFAGGSHLGREFRTFYGASPQEFAPLYSLTRPVTTTRTSPTGARSPVINHLSPVTNCPRRQMSRLCPDVAFMPYPGIATNHFSVTVDEASLE